MKRIFWAGILLLQLIIVKAANVFKMALLVSPYKTPPKKKQHSNLTQCMNGNTTLSWVDLISKNKLYLRIQFYLFFSGNFMDFWKIIKNPCKNIGDHLKHAKKKKWSWEHEFT